MKQILSKTDKISLIKSLKTGMLNVSELNHLFKEIDDKAAEIELFGDIELPLSANDKRQILASLNSGSIDFERMPDLKAKIQENFFLTIMKECNED